MLTFIYSWSFKLTSVAFSERELGGGPGLAFEIDESVLNGNIMLALLSNNSEFLLAFAGEKQCLLFAVNNRSAASLLPIIVEQIAPGSLIILDQWSSYNGIRNTNQNYNYQTLNHSRHFIDPVTGAHTNAV